ncbi:hypothetical protein HCN44_008343 [Aphidius gifuensis]|uniref:Uncharacterized protein n=1 Tax=Aphidius gifuensis TaxID=684658 RepID=A0A835CMB1_APHGI|nr:putative mediator of RNA polymerase II transcription subunit 26 [Aphidius gifuensis]KAF7989669.1 hypothetical protein HCN44_008343 [Aphidius gifuensis]
MIKQILIFLLCVIITQVHSAPSGCVNLCSEPIGGVGGAGYNNQASESLSAFQTHAAIQQNSALQNFQNLQNQLLHGSQLNLGYVRPGNWSERDQWATDGGAGKVHEERGQLETGNAKVQYYKKNYTASFGTGGGGGMIIGNSLLGTQNSAGLFNQQNYDQQSSNLNSAVEDFSGTTHGVQMGNELQTRLRELQSQMDQFNVNFHQQSLPITTTSSFESHMSQLKTRIDQANNQIRQNNNIIQNSHSSNANQNYEFQKNMQQLVKSYENRMQELRRMLDQITQQSQQQTSQVTQPNYHQQPNQYTESVNIPETNIYQQHYDYKSQHKQNNYVPSTQSYVVPSDNLQQSQRYQQQTYVPNDRVTSYPYQQQQQQQHSQAYEQSSLDHQQSQHHGTKNIKRIPIYHNNRYQNYREEAASELDTSNDNLQHSLVNQNAGQTIVPSGSGKRVEEHWSASGHRSETIIPHHVVADTAASNQQLFERIRQQQQQQQQHQQQHQQHRSGSSHYTSGGSSSVYQQSGGQYNTGVLDAGHNPDCDTETQAQYNSRYQRRYRRGIRDGSSRHTDNLNQQTEDFSQQTQQNYQNFNQEHNGRLHHGQHEHDHDHVNRHQGQVEENQDFSQQHQTQSSQHELGSQRHHENTHDRYGGNYHQQQSTSADYDQHTDSQSRHHHNDNDQDQYDRHDHLEHGGYRHQQTQVSQQEAGQFEFGQQTHSYHQRPGQYALQTENLSQQAQGFGDFTQQQQNSSEFTQQSSSHLDFNQNDNSFGARPAPKPTRRGQNSLNYETMDTEVIRPVGVKGGRPKKIQQLQSSNSDASTVIGIENQQQNAGLNWHMGHHPGDLTSDNYQQQNIPELYSQTTGIKPTPLVTLSPLYGNDPWDVREKQDVYSNKDIPLIQSSYSTDDASTTIKPGFWNRISNKITNTYEKAKDKMSDVIG